jgi:hypothetical protein
VALTFNFESGRHRTLNMAKLSFHATEEQILDLLNEDPFRQFPFTSAQDNTFDAVEIVVTNSIKMVGIEEHIRNCDTCRTTAMLMQWMHPAVVLEVCAQEAEEIGIRVQEN